MPTAAVAVKLTGNGFVEGGEVAVAVVVEAVANQGREHRVDDHERCAHRGELVDESGDVRGRRFPDQVVIRDPAFVAEHLVVDTERPEPFHERVRGPLVVECSNPPPPARNTSAQVKYADHVLPWAGSP